MSRRYVRHSAEGTTWTKKNHKYIRKEGNNYIYPEDLVSEKNIARAVADYNNSKSEVTSKTKAFIMGADDKFKNVSGKKDLLKNRASLETTKSNVYNSKGKVSDEKTSNSSSSGGGSSKSSSYRSMPTAYNDRGLTIKQMARLYGSPTGGSNESVDNAFANPDDPSAALSKLKDGYKNDKFKNVSGKKDLLKNRVSLENTKSNKSKGFSIDTPISDLDTRTLAVAKQMVNYMLGFKK